MNALTRRLRLPLMIAAGLAMTIPAASFGETQSGDFDLIVAEILSLPYDQAAVPSSVDSAFGPMDYPAAFPLTDTTTGSCCTGPVVDQEPLVDLAPPFAEFPAAFSLVELSSFDGTPLHAFVALHPGAPGVVVMHGFNTNGKYSAVRYGAVMYANGYSVIVPDHRDMGREWARGGSWHPDGTRHGQTLGWKEAEDLLSAAQYLADQGAGPIGVLGFSEGAQNTILALGIDYDGIISTALTFSPPADQATLAQRNAESTSALLTTVVNNPDLCNYLAGVGARTEFSATPNFMLRNDSAVDALDGIIGGGVNVPALHFYTDDDELVPSWNATILASRTNTMPMQHTVLLPIGNHAYFIDRWWTQRAALAWFGHWLDPDASHTSSAASVAMPANGTPAGDQQIDLSGVTRADGDAEMFGDACPDAAAAGPTALLAAGGEDGVYTLDGRRSYSGWDEHDIVSWTLNPGDGSAASIGTDVRQARVVHGYLAAGTYTAMLTVRDDTGRSAVESVEIVVDSPAPDADADGLADAVDNCINIANADQCDTNGDGFGNVCDADLDNNNIVNSFDLSLLRDNLGQSGDNDADLDCNGIVNSFDLSSMRGDFGQPPGPSGIAP